MLAREYSRLDAVALSELIASGETTSGELIALAHAGAQELKTLSAVVEERWETPLDCDARQGFRGVPFAIKDLMCHAAGVPVHSGSRATAPGVVRDYDSTLMSRFRSAGLAVIGTSTSAEYGLGCYGEVSYAGPTRNPWDPERTVGGSSCGAAALVAAGILPMAHGNDGAGSIRIPASYTGLVGLKPSRGAVPIGPTVWESTYGMAAEFALTRTVRDARALFSMVSGIQPGEKYAVSVPLHRVAGPMRVAVSPLWFGPTDADPAVSRVLSETAAALGGRGHRVEEVTPPSIDWGELVELLTTAWSALAATSLGRLLEQRRDLSEEGIEALLEPSTLGLLRYGRSVGLVELDRCLTGLTGIARRFAAFMEEYDALLTPCTRYGAPLLGENGPERFEGSAIEWVERQIAVAPVAPLFNISGHPAITLPVGITSERLPFGLHLGGRNLGEAWLFDLAAEIEEDLPWKDRRPDHWYGM
ncbi:MAG: amidase [Candidatus Leucobacter sulfamidivorax]|nr:amidase [Candidatus Leucobacter sulfamidivorax]